MAICTCDAITTLHRPLKIKKANEQKSVHGDRYSYLIARGHKPMFNHLDDEISKETQDLLEQAM